MKQKIYGALSPVKHTCKITDNVRYEAHYISDNTTVVTEIIYNIN